MDNHSTREEFKTDLNDIETMTGELNITYTPSSPISPYPTWHIEPQWFKTLLYVVTVIGILLNLTFLFTVSRVPALRSSITNYYLVNLSVTDLAFLIIYPIYRQSVVAPSYIIIQHFLILLLGVSELTIAVVSVERFVAICWPFVCRRISSKSRTIKVILAIWFLAIVFSTLNPVFKWFVKLTPDEWLTLLVISYIPLFTSLIVTSVLFSILIFKMSPYNSRNGVSQTQVDRFQVVRMLVITAAVLFICITPNIVVNAMFYTGSSPPLNYYWVTILLLLINSSVNPIIYNASSAKYRRGLVKAFTFQLCTRKPQTVNTGGTGRKPSQSVTVQSQANASIASKSLNVVVQFTAADAENDPDHF